MDTFRELLEKYDLVGAFVTTLKLTGLSAIGSLLIGTLVAVMRVSPVTVMRVMGAGYVNIVRNTPLTVVIVFCQLGLYVQLGLKLADQDIASNVFRLAVLGLSVYHAAFVAEALRSGVNTVPLGQAEAARAIGLPFLKTLRYVVLPQAFRGAVAPLTNVLIALTKNSTVASLIGVAEISYLMKGMIEENGDAVFYIFALVAMGFVIIILPVGALLTALSKRLAVQR